MRYAFLSDFNSSTARLVCTAVIVLSLMAGACSSSKESTQTTGQNGSGNSQGQNTPPPILKSDGENTQPADSTGGESGKITLTYKNESSTVTIPIDPANQRFRVTLNGVSLPQHDTTAERTEEELREELQKEIQQVMRDFRKAQDHFYQEEYKEALKYVNRSLRTQRTADALALKGTIFFMSDNMKSARYYWNEAVKMNPEIPVPEIPELEMIIDEIKAEEQEQQSDSTNIQNEEGE